MGSVVDAKHPVVRALVAAFACAACASACQPSARTLRAQRDDPPASPTCKGHIVATEAPPDWRAIPVVAESGTPSIVDVVDEGEGRREVREVILDRFFVRYAKGSEAKAIGLLEIRERTCGEARIVFRPEWSGGVLHLRRRVLEYVVTWTPGEERSETPLAAVRWVPDPPKTR